MKGFTQYYHHHDNITVSYKINFPKKEFNNAKNVLVFNYGLLCSNEHWRKQIDYFHTLGLKIFLHDYRGHHDSPQEIPIKSCTFKNMAMDILNILSLLQVQSCILLGHSMGVNICLEMVEKKSELFSKMVFISGILLPPKNTIFNSNLVDISLPYFSYTMETFPKIFHFFWEHSHKNPFITQLVHFLGFHPQKVPRSFIKDYVKKMSGLNPKLLFQLFEEMRNYDTISKLEKINISTLIMMGDKDRIVPDFQQRIFQKYIKGSQLQPVKDAGHVPQWDFPDYVNEKILSFVHSNEA